MELEERVRQVEIAVATGANERGSLRADLTALERLVERLTVTMNARPSWAVTVYLTLTTAVATGLLGGFIGVRAH